MCMYVLIRYISSLIHRQYIINRYGHNISESAQNIHRIIVIFSFDEAKCYLSLGCSSYQTTRNISVLYIVLFKNRPVQIMPARPSHYIYLMRRDSVCRELQELDAHFNSQKDLLLGVFACVLKNYAGPKVCKVLHKREFVVKYFQTTTFTSSVCKLKQQGKLITKVIKMNNL